jgi:hypothetical protein
VTFGHNPWAACDLPGPLSLQTPSQFLPDVGVEPSPGAGDVGDTGQLPVTNIRPPGAPKKTEYVSPAGSFWFMESSWPGPGAIRVEGQGALLVAGAQLQVTLEG